MLRRMFVLPVVVVALGMLVAAAPAAELESSLDQEGTLGLSSIGPIAFGPDGILFVSDPKAATLYAIDTGDRSATGAAGPLDVADLGAKLASLLGAPIKQIPIHDLAVNPASGKAYLSITRGLGPDAVPMLVRVDRSGKVEEFSLDNVKYAKAVLPNPAEPGSGRRGNGRLESITDLEYVDGRIFVAGLSNEEFASKLRSIPFPFEEVDLGSGIEIFHGSHGRLETRSPIRTFTHYAIADEPHLLAAYTCTPLVKIPIAALKSGAEVRGITIAELGNHNRPLDMFVYQKDDKDFILMANSARGVMKISTENIDDIAGIFERIPDTSGLHYETIDQLEGVVQLARLDDSQALLLVQKGDEDISLKSIPLP